MIWPVYILYILIVGLIRVYKWFELQVLKLFTPLLKKKGKQIAESVGGVLHCRGDPDTLGQAEIERILSKSKYDKLIHFRIADDSFFPRICNLGTLAAGNLYMEGITQTMSGDDEDSTEFAARVMENELLRVYYNPWNKLLEYLELYAFNLQTRQRAFQVGQVHYDLGNDLYENMLDPWMQYTCGYWKNADNLEDAQIAKMELIAKKLDLKPGMRVLDIGCGWGYLCKFLSMNYGVECVGVTISVEGAEYGKKLCEGLPIEIRVQDYREVKEKFDRIVSVGMFEHVGHWNYREYFQTARKCLTDDGIFLLHTIGINHSQPYRSEPWIEKYIFPNGQAPRIEDITATTKDLFIIEDLHNFGPDYARTLYHWRANFNRNWPKLKAKYDKGSFYRMWIYYLSTSRAAFKARRLQLWQIVLSKDGLKREYRAAR